jgi:hypothetical protein
VLTGLPRIAEVEVSDVQATRNGPDLAALALGVSAGGTACGRFRQPSFQ